MAKLHHLEWQTRAECLEAIASAYGDYPPRGDVPAWWSAFEKWYQAEREKAEKGVVSMTLRTEAVFYDDEYEDGDESEDEEEEEEEPEDEPTEPEE